MDRLTLLPLAAVTAIIVVGALAGCTRDHEPSPGGSGYAVSRCADDGTCADPATVCSEGLCLEACTADTDCPMGAVCISGECFADRGGACTADADCAAGEACVAGVCGELPPTIGCSDDADCPRGSCVMGACVSDPAGGCDPTTAEACGDGIDNDCDGAVDEGCDPARCGDDVDCGVRQICCAGVCADPLSDPSHCGACGAVCAMGEVCSSGVCGGGCDPADPRCTPACDPTIPETCGDGIDNDCDGLVDEDCPAMACAADTDCSPIEFCCGGTCSDLLYDPRNCGTCGSVCPAGTACEYGVCTAGDPMGCDPSTPERCGDGVDNDCDGLVDEDCGRPA